MMSMFKEKKNIGIFLGIVILCLVIMLPQIYFSIMDRYAYEREHKMDKISFELSSDVKDIVMVRRLHEVLNSYYSEQSIENIHLVQGEFFQVINDENDVSVVVSNYDEKVRSMVKEAGFAQYIPLKNFQRFHSCVKSKNDKRIELYELKSKKEKLELKWDNETEKLLYLKYRGENINEITDQEIYALERDYIKYMNLSLVEDWNYNNQKMVSKKAHLSVEVIVNEQKNTIELVWKIIE